MLKNLSGNPALDPRHSVPYSPSVQQNISHRTLLNRALYSIINFMTGRDLHYTLSENVKIFEKEKKKYILTALIV